MAAWHTADTKPGRCRATKTRPTGPFRPVAGRGGVSVRAISKCSVLGTWLALEQKPARSPNQNTVCACGVAHIPEILHPPICECLDPDNPPDDANRNESCPTLLFNRSTNSA